jgi:MinD-like ATPase involved in chromosome partitioning or flagellar assembly
MAKTLGIIAIKGGVGKTTISASLASDLVNHFGKKVLLIDANYSAPNLGLHMDIVEPKKTIHQVLDRKVPIRKAIHNKFGVDVIPGDYIYNNAINYHKIKDKLKPIKKDYDFIIIDSSPSLNDELLSTMLTSDILFVVTTPDYPTLSCSLKAAKLAKQRGKPIAGIILNKVRDPKFELTLKEIEQATDIPVIAKIPDDKITTRSTFTRIPTSIYHKKCAFSKEISHLSAVLAQQYKKQSFLQRIFSLNFKKEHINRQLLKDYFYINLFQEDTQD